MVFCLLIINISITFCVFFAVSENLILDFSANNQNKFVYIKKKSVLSTQKRWDEVLKVT